MTSSNPHHNTRCLKVDKNKFKTLKNLYKQISPIPQDSTVLEAAELLKNGQIVAIPTETVYGLAADATQSKAVENIFKAKQRPLDNPLIVHVSSLEMIKEFILPEGVEISLEYLELMNQFWPGPLTLVMPVDTNKIPSVVRCGLDTVAVRFPSHPVSLSIIDALGKPIAAPSANSSGKPSPTTAQHVLQDLNGKIPLVIDGGPCDSGVESTVVDGISQSPPAILRSGGVSWEEIVKLPHWNHVRVYKRDFDDVQMEQVPTTPGMKYRHYSPDTLLKLVNVDMKTDLEVLKLVKQDAELNHYTKFAFIYASTGQTDVVPGSTSIHNDHAEYYLGPASDTSIIARHLFHALRWIDDVTLKGEKLQVAYITSIPESHQGLAVMERLRKACQQVI